MAKNNNFQDFVTDIADAIRIRRNETELYNPQDFYSKIISGSSDIVLESIQQFTTHIANAIRLVKDMDDVDIDPQDFYELIMSKDINFYTANVGDICLYSKNTNSLLIVEKKYLKYYMDHVPVGVVVIPSSHNVYGDNTCALVSLKNMSCITPKDGTNEGEYIYYGLYGLDVPTLKNFMNINIVGSDGVVTNSIQSIKREAYLPSDLFYEKGINNPYDTDTYYYYASGYNYTVSPYNTDDSRNELYYDTSINEFNVLSDFDGFINTKKLVSLHTIDDLSTATTITNNSGVNSAPGAACCCLYETIGTNKGDWYLPALGEIGYVQAKFLMIEDSFNKIKEIYGDDACSVLELDGYLSSTEASDIVCRTIYFLTGGIYGYNKNNIARNVRAFYRINKET